MDKSSKINWFYIISIKEFQSYLNLNLLKETSMVSKLMREKLKPALFNSLKLNLDNIKFNNNIISIAYNNRIAYLRPNIKPLGRENSGDIERALNDFIIELNDISKYTKSFCYYINSNAGYYLYSLINLFYSLTELKIYICKIPFRAFADIGKRLPNLKKLELENVDLIKSTTDVISVNDMVFPPNLSYLKLSSVYIITSNLLPDPYEYILDKKDIPISFEDFSLPKISIPTLKRLDFLLSSKKNCVVEEFLEINPNIESLLTRSYNLNINNSLNSLKSIDSDDFIAYDNVDQAFKLNSVNSLAFLNNNFNDFENIRRLCQLCPNAVNISIDLNTLICNFQTMIDRYLVPILSYKSNLKTLNILNICIDSYGQNLDFTKFSQVEKLKIKLAKGSAVNIKFDTCENLKRVELISNYGIVTDEFKKCFNHYDNWKFKFSGKTVKGYKI